MRLSAGASPAPPRMPMPFAVARNAHEALRGSLKDCKAAIEAGDLEAFKEHWAGFKRGGAVHQAMEDAPGGMFQYFEAYFDGAPSKAGLLDAHSKVEAQEGGVDQVRASAPRQRSAPAFRSPKSARFGKNRRATLPRVLTSRLFPLACDSPPLSCQPQALTAGDAASLKAAYDTFADAYEEHMKAEEDMLMPLTQKVGATPAERAKVANQILVAPMEATGDFDFFIGWVVRMLVKHKPAEAVRVFIWGLQYATTAAQYAALLPTIKAVVPEPMFAAMAEEFQLEEPGKVEAA